MKSFDEFVSEKFDYTKQSKKYKNFKDLKVGDSIYYYDYRKNKFCEDVIKSIGGLKHTIKNVYQEFYMKENYAIEVAVKVNNNEIFYPVMNIRVCNNNKEISYPGSTDEILLIDWLNSDKSAWEFSRDINY